MFTSRRETASDSATVTQGCTVCTWILSHWHTHHTLYRDKLRPAFNVKPFKPVQDRPAWSTSTQAPGTTSPGPPDDRHDRLRVRPPSPCRIATHNVQEGDGWLADPQPVDGHFISTVRPGWWSAPCCSTEQPTGRAISDRPVWPGPGPSPGAGGGLARRDASSMPV